MKRKLYSSFAIFLGVIGTLLFVNASEIRNSNSHKFSILKPHNHERAPANFNKARAPINVSVLRIDEGSTPEVIRLKGTVTAARDFQNLNVTWAVPEDVEILSGSSEASLSVSAGESQSFEILISQKHQDNRQIYFHATSDQGENEKFGASAQYNTTHQEIIAKQLKENFLKAREKVRSGELRKIIF